MSISASSADIALLDTKNNDLAAFPLFTLLLDSLFTSLSIKQGIPFNFSV